MPHAASASCLAVCLAVCLAALAAPLAAAEEKGGDGAHWESAVVRISKEAPHPYLDLRVDKREEPVKELSRLFEIWRLKTAPKA